MILPKKWYFVICKPTEITIQKAGKKTTKEVFAVDFFLYLLPNGKFYFTLRREKRCMFNCFQALRYQCLFHAPAWLYKNGNLFGYRYTTGRVLLKRID